MLTSHSRRVHVGHVDQTQHTNLSCAPQRISELFDPKDRSWRAKDVITAVEAARQSLRVNFYMYDRDIPGGTDVAKEVAKIDKCVAAGLASQRRELAQYSGEYWFVKSLLVHPWRVFRPAEAEILVVPVFLSFEHHRGCPGLTPAHKTLRAINQTGELQARLNDHLYVAQDYRNNFPKLFPAGGVTRAFVEITPAEPNLHGKIVPRSPRQMDGREDFRLAVPYVDNSNMHGDWDSVPAYGTRRLSHRNLTFFFGGSTVRNLPGSGLPGRKAAGYYIRHHLMRSWSRASQDELPGTILVASDSRFLRWMAVVRCEPAKVGPNKSLARPPLSDAYGVKEGTRCLPACTDELLAFSTAGACSGRYSAQQMLSRTIFAICTRGDVPTSPRPYDAIRHGAIPVILGDNVWALGMPFQCFVPYDLMTVSISERQLLRVDLPGSLRNISASIDSMQLSRMQELINHFSRDVLWFFRNVSSSRVAENLLLEAARWRLRKPQGCCPLWDRSVDALI